MVTTRIVAGQVSSAGGLRLSTVTVVDGIIAETGAAPDDAVSIDADGLVVSPGFIDLQINGGFGLDLLSEPRAMWDLGERLPQHGVTSFLPTIITSRPANRSAALAALGERPTDYRGAEPLGVHFEGPMLSPRRPGAHPVELFVAPDLDVIEDWSRENGVVMVTIAPELPGAAEVIAELVRRGVVVAAGHSDATAAEAVVGRDVGATMVTHLFNAMAPFGHRSPNLVGATLADRDVCAGLIVDGVHVDPVAVATAWNAKGPRAIALITDAVAPMGCAPGTFDFAGRAVVSTGTSVHDRSGVLAGSVLTMDRAIRNLVGFTGCEPAEALESASATPAALIGDSRRGHMSPGAVADIVLLDQSLEVQITMCEGRVAFVADAAEQRIQKGR